MKMAMAKIQAFIGKDCGCASGTDMIKDVADLRSKKYDETFIVQGLIFGKRFRT